jgi:DNA adenine methylase
MSNVKYVPGWGKKKVYVMGVGESGVRTPIAYYGGKKQMVNRIIRMIPKHYIYCEPFGGSGTVLFAKNPSPAEILNDRNGELINFFIQMKTKPEELYTLIDRTLHSRDQYETARAIYRSPEGHSDLDRAWAVWVMANETFYGQLGGTFAFDHDGKTAVSIYNKKLMFPKCIDRLKFVTLENRDAVKIIEMYDMPDTFFYLDPPYPGTYGGHYKGYTLNDFNALLGALRSIKGKFLLSSFATDVLEIETKKNGWERLRFTFKQSAANKFSAKDKTELFTANYHIQDVDADVNTEQGEFFE